MLAFSPTTKLNSNIHLQNVICFCKLNAKQKYSKSQTWQQCSCQEKGYVQTLGGVLDGSNSFHKIFYNNLGHLFGRDKIYNEHDAGEIFDFYR